MARRKVWDADKTDFQNLASAAISLSLVESTIAGIDLEGCTLIRMVGTFAVRTQTVSQTPGWVNAMWITRIASLDKEDITASDFESTGFGAYHTEDIPLTGLAFDSTSVADQRPLTIVKFDVKNRRKIRQNEKLFLTVFCESGVAVEFSAQTRTLWMLP